jgi:XTP/dITP diphosphohydrolase
MSEQNTAPRLPRLVLATNNKHKVSELKPLLESRYQLSTLEQIGCEEELPETTDTLEGNSLQKAQYLFDHYKLACIADDSGLEVEALNGEPGVYSARYAGPQRNSDDNIDLLLEKLKPHANRKARFRSVITLIDEFGNPRLFEGTVNGRIIEGRRGTDGFGYDPIFVPEGYHQTFAEISFEEKNQISHRARAIQKLFAFFQET